MLRKDRSVIIVLAIQFVDLVRQFKNGPHGKLLTCHVYRKQAVKGSVGYRPGVVTPVMVFVTEVNDASSLGLRFD